MDFLIATTQLGTWLSYRLFLMGSSPNESRIGTWRPKRVAVLAGGDWLNLREPLVAATSRVPVTYSAIRTSDTRVRPHHAYTSAPFSSRQAHSLTLRLVCTFPNSSKSRPRGQFWPLTISHTLEILLSEKIDEFCIKKSTKLIDRSALKNLIKIEKKCLIILKKAKLMN